MRTRPGAFTLLTGTPTLYIKATAESGTKRDPAFCPRCGMSIYAAGIEPEPRTYSLRFGTLKDRDRLVPRRQIWTRSRVAWLSGLDAVPEHKTQP